MSERNIRSATKTPVYSIEDYSILDEDKPASKDLSVLISKSTAYLCYLEEPSKILIDKRAGRAVLNLKKYSKDIKNLKEFFKYERAITVFVNTLLYYIDELKEYLRHFNESAGDDALYVSSLKTFLDILVFLTNMTNTSKSYCVQFHDHNGTYALLAYLNEFEMCESLYEFTVRRGNSEIRGKQILRFIISCVYNISSHLFYLRKDFEKLNGSNIVMKYLRVVHGKSKDDTIVACVTLANFINDNEIETLKDSKLAMEYISELIKVMANKISTKTDLNRMTIDVEIEDDVFESRDICSLKDGWNIVELLNAVYRFAINDKMKYDAYELYNMKDYLKEIIINGNETEKLFAYKLLWQLCFDKNVALNVRGDKKLLEYIKSEKSSLKSFKKYCDGILWSIETQVIPGESHSQGKHIMISYNSQSRELCLKIKNELEALKYQVWIDVENIHGSSLDSMAKAIESSLCVLICMSEQYKQSAFCRAEAEYAFTMHKPIVPLILQQNYMADGWLGFIVGSKIYINFTKYSFKECFKRLVSEISDACKIETVTKSNTIKPPNQTYANIMRWTRKDVENWLKEFNIEERICKILYNFDGTKLYALKMTKNDAPDYFYMAISKQNEIDLFSVLHFVQQFEKLFER